jgi:catechol 2,3-dioxygenase-like lactoylglutathione lyase family enzyme
MEETMENAATLKDRGSDRDKKREAATWLASSAHPDKYIGKSPVKVKKLGHLTFQVSDVERTVRFWTQVMGFEEVERNEKGIVFLRFGPDHHSIGIAQGAAKRRATSEEGLNTGHLAFEVENTDVLFATRDYLKENNIPIVFEGRKGPGCNISLHLMDPDGYEFELYCNLDQIDDSGLPRPAEQFARVQSLEEAVENPVPKSW